MNRDELIDKLAMELGEWPATAAQANEIMPEGWYWRGYEVVHVGGGLESFRVHVDDWLQRRAELINKPSWDDAPEWAQWLAQDESAKDWWWYEDKPKCGANGEWNPCTMSKRDRAGLGFIPNGHDWRQTLEPRPDFNESRADAIGQNGPTGDHYMTPEEEEIPAQEKHDCPRCGGCYYSPPHEECPCQPSATTADGILAAARQHMLDRASTYDKPEGERSMNSTVLAFAAVTGVLMTEEQGWLFMQLLKAVRSQQGDYRADSYEDGAAYVALAGEAAARDRRHP